MLFCGIDLHSNNCFVVASDDADKVVYSKRLPNDRAAMRATCSHPIPATDSLLRHEERPHAASRTEYTAGWHAYSREQMIALPSWEAKFTDGSYWDEWSSIFR